MYIRNKHIIKEYKSARDVFCSSFFIIEIVSSAR